MVEIYKNAISTNEQDLLDILRARRFLIKDDITRKECLTNAGTHRNYAISGEHTKILKKNVMHVIL